MAIAIKIGTAAVVLLGSTMFIGCLPYLYETREPAIIENIDVDQTLDVAEAELAEPSAFAVLTIWAIRDQVVTEEQAQRISQIYLENIERIDNEELRGRRFAVWHLTWAIANLYRFGDPQVRGELAYAYADAILRVEELDMSIAREHATGETIYSGLAHGGGAAYAKKHLVVPGNDDYLQSFAEYREQEVD